MLHATLVLSNFIILLILSSRKGRGKFLLFSLGCRGVWLFPGMTEYKKLCALVDQLKQETAVLIDAFKDDDRGDVVALHSQAVSVQTLITNCRPRVVKILHKGREKDPDKQIYNERMCVAIEQLFEDFCTVVGSLFDTSASGLILSEENLNYEECPPLAWVEDLYDEHVLRLAQTEAWQKRLAGNVVDLVRMEVESRDVCAAEEKRARAALMMERKSEKNAVQQMLDEREAAKWFAEIQRREAEHEGLLLKSKLYDISAAPSVLKDVSPPFRGPLALNVLQLVRALRTTPEDSNIRRIRCNNLRVMTEYGHVALCSECHTCWTIVTSTEVLWYMLGYTVEYSSLPTVHIPTLIESNPSLRLPCGGLASEHVFFPVGFEDYSERLFVLHEPNPTEEPNEWMDWYTRMGAIVHSLEACKF
ncbi:hypothetical protein, conserved [Trypanosoma brucei brucei TREU927]|uniref:PUB domain-containing protein n=1 Tax=Trypanosoma brucei brucei (strain 927/4 GUTat10.1) TaxID=185431 RepID=Q386J6_TRYB2|nr:hypothetical protein, conserved [Trypanosoma brucei brucei TREU927]EAN79285.1 hypothetical protein, conserved [Trypanosoma brucei brucei TREU927]